MKKSFQKLMLLFAFVIASNFCVNAQVLVGSELNLISNESSGWFNQIKLQKNYGSWSAIRHVIADHGGRDRLVIYPGYGGGAKSEVEISGKVAIGTTNIPTSVGGASVSSYKLFVKGGILTEEVRVRTGWADYVFDEGYKLPTLSEVEYHINEHGHLINMPSADQVENQGLPLGDMAVKQQEKIEELFLYVIELGKKIQVLEKENIELKEKLKK
ncbi:MAG: hypothetical protein R2828_30080 [Saprospiraceae bacterium]